MAISKTASGKMALSKTIDRAKQLYIDAIKVADENYRLSGYAASHEHEHDKAYAAARQMFRDRLANTCSKQEIESHMDAAWVTYTNKVALVEASKR